MKRLPLLALLLLLTAAAFGQDSAATQGPLRMERQAGRPLNLAVTAGKFIDDFQIVNPTDGAIAVDDIHVVGHINDQVRVSDAAKWSFYGLKDSIIRPGGRAYVHVDVELNVVGEYTVAYLVEWHAVGTTKQMQSVFPSTWDVTALPKTPETPSPVFFKIKPLPNAQWVGNEDMIEMVVSDTSKYDGALGYPTISIFCKGDTGVMQTKKDSVSVWVMQGGKPQWWKPGTTCMIKKSEDLPLRIQVHGLKPGETYEAHVEFHPLDGKEVVESMDIAYKRSGWVAFGLIFAGVAFAALFRVLLDKKGRLQQRKRLAELKSQLDALVPDPANADAPVKNLMDALQEKLNWGSRQIRWSAISDADFKTMATLLHERIEVFMQWLSLRKIIAEHKFENDPVIQPAMSAVEVYLYSSKGDSDEARAKLGEVVKKIDELLHPVSRERGLDFKAQSTQLPSLTALPPQELSVRSITFQLILTEVVTNSISFVVASIGGVLLFWATDDAWGSLTDILVAVTWGFGINTLAKDTKIQGGAAGYVIDLFKPEGQ